MKRYRGHDLAAAHRSWSVRSYLFGIAGTAILLVGIFGAFVTVERFQETRGEALKTGNREANRVANDISLAVSEGITSVGQTASSPDLALAFATPEGCSLTSSGIGAFSAVHLDLIDPNGRVVCSSHKEKVSLSTDYSKTEWLTQVPNADAPVISETFVDAMTGKLSFAIAAPVLDQDSRFAGSGAAILAVDGVSADLVAGNSSLSGLDIVVVDRESGLVLSDSSEPERQGSKVEGTGFDANESGEFDGLDGTRRLYGASTVDGRNWQVFVGQDSGAVMAGANATLRQSLAFWALILIFLSFAVYLANRKIALPLRRLSAAIGVARGELLPSEISVDGPTEVVSVANQYNEMLKARGDYEERLMYQALHDSLTDLPNRQLALDRIGQALRRGLRAEELAVLVVDLDRFKVLNDSLGHDLGDRVLLEVVERLQGAIRPQDTIARFGGDEFVVVCDELDAGYEAVNVAEEVQRVLRLPFSTPVGPAVLTASIGIAFNKGGGDLPQDLLRDANAAMHRAKDQGRARYEVFDDELGDRVTDRLRIENDLRTAIENRSLQVHYQPKVSLKEGRIVGAEALVRWEHPDRGWLSPLKFVGIAEDSGLIVPLGNFVLDEATQQVNEWTVLAGEQIHVAVNLSGRQLTQPDFPKTLTRILETNGVDPLQVCLEVTEAILLDDGSPVSEVLGRLSSMGFTMSLDDFGTGYSSLAYLGRFPFDELKIDRAFVHALGTGENEGALIAAILGMAKALRLNVVAEGIERQGQLTKLMELGCETGQGFLFARPQSAEDFSSLLKSGGSPLAGGEMASTLLRSVSRRS